MSSERRRLGRQRILNGAVNILNGGVYGDLTVDALARSLQMSKSTLYKYFASKEDVIVAVIDEVCNVTEEQLDDLVLDGSQCEASLTAITKILADHVQRMPRAAVLQRRRLPAACQDRLALTRATMGRAYEVLLQSAHDSGAFPFAQPGLAAVSLLASAEASTLASARGELSCSRSEAVMSVLALVLPGLRGASPVA